jgi:hypothetical protein
MSPTFLLPWPWGCAGLCDQRRYSGAVPAVRVYHADTGSVSAAVRQVAVAHEAGA